MPQFSNSELADIHFLYGFCNGNSRAAQREYRRRFPNRRVPGRQVFVDTHRNLSDHGNFRRVRGQGRPLVEYNMEDILNVFDNNPQISIRTVSRNLNVPKTTVMRNVSTRLGNKKPN